MIARVHDYAQDVIDGKIIAGPHVRDACARHQRDLENLSDRYYFDQEAADRACSFFPDLLSHYEGQFADKPFELLDWQQFIVGSLYGWKRLDNDKRRFRRAYIETAKGPLALDTPILTTEGWSCMGDLQPGMQVYTPSGVPTQIVAVSDIFHDRECWEFEFDCGERIVSDADHRWITEMRRLGANSGDALRGVPPRERGQWRFRERTTAEIVQTLRYPNGQHQSANHSIAVTQALTGATNDGPLPIDPYILGFWLGDGDSDGARVTIGGRDLAEQCSILKTHGAKIGEPISQRSNPNAFRVTLREDVNPALRHLNLLHNKHIPEQYLNAPISARLALLQGLMDSDGTIAGGHSAEFCSCNERLATDALDLIRRMGIKAQMHDSPAKIEGRQVGTRHRMHIAPGAMPIFALSRKADRLGVSHNRRRLAGDHRIIEAQPVDSIPVRCITVEHPSHLFLAGRALIPTCNSGKSPLIAGLGVYAITSDGEMGAEGYIAARKADQALVTFRPAAEMVRRSPDLSLFLEVSGGRHPYNISFIKKLSFLRRLAGKGLSGPRPHIIIIDEYHEHESSETLDLLSIGVKFRQQPLTIIITNAGSDPLSPCGVEHSFAISVASGDMESESYFSYVCALDEDDEPFRDERCWIKTNPSLPVAPGYEFIRDEVEQARGMPSKRSEKERLLFCIWTEAEDGFIERDIWIGCENRNGLSDDIKKAPCFGGLDIGIKKDLCAGALVWDLGENGNGANHYAGRLEIWTPEDTLRQKAETDGVPYPQWVEQGFITAVPGKVLRLEWVAQWIVETMEQYNLVGIAYDPWKIDQLEDALDEYGKRRRATPSSARISSYWSVMGRASLQGPSRSRLRMRRRRPIRFPCGCLAR